MIRFLASTIQGKTPDEKLHMWTGSGGNGKSKLVELHQSVMGELSDTVSVQLITNKRSKSNEASPDLAKTKGKRFVTFQEPEGDQINVGLMKEMTGGDKITTRKLYGEPFTFKPQYKLVLTCNHLPKIPSDDGGTWRRIILVEFISKFVENPEYDPSKGKYEFKRDSYLADKMINWKEVYMGLLVEEYKKYKKEGLTEPDEVKKKTHEYQKKSDIYLEFISENLEEKESGKVGIKALYDVFKIWYKDNYHGTGTKLPPREN